jgi:predicted nucleotidyltransferase
MDHARPLAALFPGARGAVLDVLTRVQRGMTIRQLADRAGVSHPQAARHIRDFELLGIVSRELVGRSHRITLTETMAAELLRRLTQLRTAVLHEMRTAASTLDPLPVSMVVFGSFARGDDGAASDIDVLVVIDDAVPDGRIDASLARWCDHIARLTGNPVTEIVVRRSELDTLDPALRVSIERDGVPIAGDPLPDARGLRVVAEDRGDDAT